MSCAPSSTRAKTSLCRRLWIRPFASGTSLVSNSQLHFLTAPLTATLIALSICHIKQSCQRFVLVLFLPLYSSFDLTRPPLSKKSFPVGQVWKRTASREVGIFFFFLISIFFKLECIGGKVKKKKKKI